MQPMEIQILCSGMLNPPGDVHQHGDEDFGTQELKGAGGPIGMVHHGGDVPHPGMVQDPSFILY